MSDSASDRHALLATDGGPAGQALAAALAGSGWSVHLAGGADSRLQALCRNTGVTAEIHSGDLTSEVAAEALALEADACRLLVIDATGLDGIEAAGDGASWGARLFGLVFLLREFALSFAGRGRGDIFLIAGDGLGAAALRRAADRLPGTPVRRLPAESEAATVQLIEALAR